MLKAENLILHVEDNGAKKCLLDHISFQVDDGEMLVITGPNGGGKSTLAKVLIGIEKAESGKIFLNGEDITDFDINHRANARLHAGKELADDEIIAEELIEIRDDRDDRKRRNDCCNNRNDRARSPASL